MKAEAVAHTSTLLSTARIQMHAYEVRFCRPSLGQAGINGYLWHLI